MQCTIADLREKEVVNIATGFRLGFVSDVEFDMASGQLLSLVVPGPFRIAGLIGRSEDYVIPFDAIRKIGDDIILVEAEGLQRRSRKRRGE